MKQFVGKSRLEGRISPRFVLMLSTWFFFSIILALAYAAVLLVYRRGWHAQANWELPPDFQPQTAVTVIIPARNEAASIAACLQSILDGSYPPELLEIIVVDDFSEDATAAIVRQCRADASKRQKGRVRLLALADFFPAGAGNSAKKDALTLAIAQATGELIVTTDADCLAPKDWLVWLSSVFAAAPGAVKIVAAPVAFHREQNRLQRFQSLDFLGLMGITAAGIRLGWQRLGNGANLAYPKEVFEAVGGFTGAADRASGDDLFLLQKIAQRWPDGVFFLKNAAATVLTEAKPDWSAFFQQRLRWGTKNAALPEWGPKLVLLLVFCFCWTLVVNALLLPWNGRAGAGLLVAQLALKAGADYLFLREMCRFFRREDLLRAFGPAFFLHVFYLVAVGTASLFVRQYTWKGRRVR